MIQRTRKRNRLDGYDYGRAGWYFVTICANQRVEFFWESAAAPCVGADIIRPCSPVLSQYGHFVEQAIQGIPQYYAGVVVDKYVIMPNHIHLILWVATSEDGAPGSSRPTQLIPRVIGAIKRFSNRDAGFNMWQKSYHDHIIRNEADYRRIWEYIDTNPAQWREDCYYEERRLSP